MSETPAMTQAAHVVGTVEVRPGDGAMQRIPLGAIDVQTTDADATLSWTEGETHTVVAMPLTDFKRCLATGSIRIDVAAPD